MTWGRDGNLLPGGYAIADQIGRGGMGVVHLAYTPRGEPVAIKLLHAERGDRYSRARMQREVQAGMRICHPNVVAVLDSHDSDSTSFVVMEFVRGSLLGDMLEREGALALEQALAVTCEILAGLAAMHAVGYVHADIKSDNILVDVRRDGSIGVKIIDLGLVRHIGDEIGQLDAEGGRVMSGTPEYMAPEIIRGNAATAASDLYAVGVILYELLTGDTPFGSGISGEVLVRHLDHAVVPPSLRRPDRAISIALERAILRALDKDPAQRFRDADSFAAALRAAAATAALANAPDDRTEADMFTTEQTTKAGGRSRIAAGSRRGSNERVRGLRESMLAALRLNAFDEVIAGSLEVARIFVDDHSMWAARAELEDTIDVLTRGAGIESPDAPPSLWRLLVTLAALYSGLRDPIRARRTALAAHRHAVRHDSDLGRERAATLLARLGRA